MNTLTSAVAPKSVREPPAGHGAGWAWVLVLVYATLVAFPLLLLLAGPIPPGGGWAWDFSMALGVAGLSVLGLQFVLSARFRRVAAPFGIDLIYFFHRWAALLGVALIAGHYLVIKLAYPDALGPLDPRDAPGHYTAGRVALLLSALVIATSWLRRALRLPYEAWRISHGALSVAAVAAAIVHVHGVGYYTYAPWKSTLWLGYSLVWLVVLVHLRLIRPWCLQRHPYEVVSVQAERGSAWTLTLRPRTGTVPVYHPGQFAWLSLGASPFKAREHPFSFSGSAEDLTQLRFTIKELGDFTRTVGTLAPGTTAYVDGPYGAFSVDRFPDASGFVFIAGGVGVAPVRAILRTLADRGDRRPLVLVYGSSSWERVLFREELEALTSRLNLRVVHVLQTPPANWTGPVGFLTEEVLRRALPPEASAWPCFLCGPKAMTDFVIPSLRRLGFPLRRLHTELFEMV